MPTTGFDTVQNIVSDAAWELGLVQADVGDPYASVDPNVLFLKQLVKRVGRSLWRVHQWNHLRGTWTFSTVANNGRYAMPPDYGAFINQAAWNRTTRLPVGGPVSAQEMQYLKARQVGVLFTILFEELQGQFQAFPDNTTPGAQIIAFEYQSRFWVTPFGTPVAEAGSWQNGTVYAPNAQVTNGGQIYKATTGGTSGAFGPAGTGAGIVDGTCVWVWVQAAGADAPTQANDLVLFDANLFMLGLKLAFLKAKGFDVVAAQDDFDIELDNVCGQDGPMPVLSMDRSPRGEPLIGDQSIPLTGFGV